MPTWHHGKARANGRDEHGKQRAPNCPDWKTAKQVERKKEAEVADIRAGLRMPTPPDKTCGDLFDYWRDLRAPLKRDRSGRVSR